MSGEEILRESEDGAVDGEPFEVSVSGQDNQKKRKKQKGKMSMASIGATGFIVLLVVIAVVFFGAGNLVPAAIQQRLLEETDAQYADMTESKEVVVQQALRDGEIPDDTAENLKQNGYTVGYMGEDGEFVEDNKAGQELSLYHDGEVISADEFGTAVDTDAGLYAAVRSATYDRAAGYYDESAGEVFTELGTERNNFTADDDFEAVMQEKMGSGSTIDINSAGMTTKQTTRKNEKGEDEIVEEEVPEMSGSSAGSGGDVAAFIDQVTEKNPAATQDESAVKAADTLKVADAVSQEQRSSLFYALFMENISKMKAGDGSESKLHDMMNFLTEEQESEVVNVKTGEVETVSGAPLESQSLAALLAGSRADKEEVENYSEERVIKTIRNKATSASEFTPSKETVASVDGESKVKGAIGTWIKSRAATASKEVMQSVEPTVRSSLADNDYKSIKGLSAGEFLAEGAVNLGRKLAQTSGATSGDGEAVVEYARLNQAVLAMDAKADRLTLSPLDITSKNTFLGSIMYNLAMVHVKYPEVRNIATVIRRFGSVLSSAITGLLPASLAANSDEGYMTDYGSCETIGGIGAVATAGCSQIAVFDPSTLNDPFNDPNFASFVEENTKLDESGTRTVEPESDLAHFILYNVARKTPVGVGDAGILDSLDEERKPSGFWGFLNKIPFVSDLLGAIQKFIFGSDDDKRIASGEKYVDSGSNADWDSVKYAQRYAALARATAMLQQHSSDATAYSHIKYFEGRGNPVLAFLREYRSGTLARE